MKEIKVLVIGDVVGKTGRKVLASKLQGIVDREHIDLVAVNGENSAGGMGITPAIAREFFDMGAHVITTGNHVWNNRDILQIINTEERLLRPHNYPPGAPGRGVHILNCRGMRICFINLMGRVMMNPMDCPFRCFDEIYEKHKDNAHAFIVDFHGEATSEKQAFGWYCDGRASAVYGTHTHVQTADERLLNKGTGYITDIGMTGAADSVIGMKIDASVKLMLTQTRVKFEPAEGNPMVNGAVFVIDREGSCSRLYRIME